MRREPAQAPGFVDDGLLAYKNATVYVCDADDVQAGGFDVHLNIGDDQGFDHICFDATATLANRATLREAWEDAADWLHGTAQTLQAMANHIRANDYFEECDNDDED